MSFFGFGQSADIEIQLDGSDTRKMAEMKTEDGKKERYFLYYDGESVSGKVNVNLKKPGSRLEHQGVKIEFVGQIELYYDRGNHHEFTSLVKELARPGELPHNTSFDFEFNQVEKPYESYSGTNVRLRYFLRVTIVRRLSDIAREMDLLVHTLSSYPEMNNSIKMEVGIEDCLHIEFEYNKSKYHLKDVIVGKIYFLLVRIKIKHMEIAIIKRETTGSGPNTFNENETIAKYEIMDGAPVRGESIPIRVFLAGYDLTPTMRDINKKFSVRYYLNLVLVDEEERRYFKQQEITLWRKGERLRRPLQQQLMAQQQTLQQMSLNNQQSKFPQSHPQGQPPEFSPQMTAAGAEPPSPQQSQSPMHEEAPEQLPTNPSPQPQARQQHFIAPPPQPEPELEPIDDDDTTPKLPSPPTELPNSIDSPEEEFLEAEGGLPSEEEEEDVDEREPVKSSSAVTQEPVPVAQ
ncbi:vacuolar protein sorting-associated protein 26B-like isoform X2 [Homarus americanus]|uniref:vacuolar protein sorting-associated protein 26B-like isoform X2 n=1 Tax=Homarus americanus TaxID=6706 RepID=UPI001C489025|nr:vacuolar protein sorting-associated protein 26B-like isoform X2 [Homarus americanus]